MWPLFWQSQFFKINFGTALLGLCLTSSVFSQTTPLASPATTTYPGIIQTFEKLIKVDTDKLKLQTETLIKNGKVLSDASAVTNLDLGPDFLNSIILHSDPGYVRLASTSKCRFYDTILTDLLKSSEGKIKNVQVTYLNKNGTRDSSLINKKDFLNKVVSQECPESTKLISQFQIKTISDTLKTIPFDIPTGLDQCRNIHLSWLNSSKTPYLCQIYEFMKEAKGGTGDPKDLSNRQALTKILDQKLSLIQKDYIENLCTHLDEEDLFCKEFLNVSFWNKISGGFKEKIYAENICQSFFGVNEVSPLQLKECLARIKKENDSCLYPSGRNYALFPQPQCDTLSTALNFSSMRSNYQDCPANSDQYVMTNIARIFLHFDQGPIKPFQGTCSSISTGTVLDFNTGFDNEEVWKLEACYDDPIKQREICFKTYLGAYGTQAEAYPNVVTNILREMRKVDPSLKCQMVDSQDYNPLSLQYKSGCFIVYERGKCFSSQCKHQILLNDRVIDFIKLKNRLTFDYFPSSIQNEKVSQNYLLTHDFKKTGKALNNLTSIVAFFKKNQRGIIHGIGCAEDILPSFFKKTQFNQCSPLPFIIDGIIQEEDRTSLVTRTAIDSLQAPRLVSWSYIFSTVMSYQRLHPLKIWTLYGLD